MDRPVLTEAQWAWVAGILEGEGSFQLGQGRWPRVSLNMTDWDIVHRLHHLLGVGRLYTMDHRKYGTAKKVARVLDIRVGADAVWVMQNVLPWMGARRSARIREILAAWEKNPLLPRVGRTHCKHGHEYTPENTIWRTTPQRPKGFRVCRTCVNGRQRARRAVV